MTHPKDTLNGELFKWERDDQKHLRSKLGYWRMVEERMIRAVAASEGRTLTHAQVQHAVEENHRDDPTYAVYCAVRQTFSAPLPHLRELTPAEWAYLRDLLEFSNDPTAREIFKKALDH